MATAPDLAALLKELRTRTDMSQLEVSVRAGLSENYYGMIENERRRPSGPALQAILGVLPCSPEERTRAVRILAGALFPDAALRDLQGEVPGTLVIASRKRPPEGRRSPTARRVRRAIGAVVIAWSTAWGMAAAEPLSVATAVTRIPLIGRRRLRLVAV